MTDAYAKPASLIIACPVDGALNRVPKVRLGQAPRCGTCGNPLFQAKPLELTAANFERHVAKSDLPVVIDFWAAWCGPCQSMAPQFAAAAPSLEPRVRLAKLDTEAESAIAGRYGIRGIPCLIMVRHGKEIARTSGAMPASAIVAWAEQSLAGAGL